MTARGETGSRRPESRGHPGRTLAADGLQERSHGLAMGRRGADRPVSGSWPRSGRSRPRARESIVSELRVEREATLFGEDAGRVNDAALFYELADRLDRIERQLAHARRQRRRRRALAVRRRARPPARRVGALDRLPDRRGFAAPRDRWQGGIPALDRRGLAQNPRALERQPRQRAGGAANAPAPAHRRHDSHEHQTRYPDARAVLAP